MKQYIIFMLVFIGSIYTSMAQDTLANYYEGLKINEFYVGEKMANEYHWIEFYNGSDHKINLKGLFLTSSQDELKMFELDENIKIDTNAFFRIYLNKVPDNNEQTAFLNINNSEYYFAIVFATDDEGVVIDDVLYDTYTKHKSKLQVSIGRSPDGVGEWLIMEQKTPNAPNTEQNSTVFYTPVFLIGLKLGGGMNVTTSLSETATQSIINLKPYISNSFGMYTRLNLSRLYFTADFMYRKRMYRYDYELSDSTHKAIFTKEIEGRQSVGAVEIGLGTGTYITSKFNVFVGLNLGLTVIANNKYSQKLNASIKKENEDGIIYWESLQELYEAPEESNYDNVDIFKVNAVIGARYELYKHLHITLTYLNDIIGTNLTENGFKRRVKFRTVLIGVEIPITIEERFSHSWF